MLRSREENKEYTVSSDYDHLMTFSAVVTALDEVTAVIRDLLPMYQGFARGAKLSEFVLTVQLDTEKHSYEFSCCSPEWEKEIRMALRDMEPPALLTMKPATPQIAKQLVGYLTRQDKRAEYALVAREKVFQASQNRLIGYANAQTR